MQLIQKLQTSVLILTVLQWRWVRSTGGIVLTKEKQSTWGKPRPWTTSSTTNLKGNGPISNPSSKSQRHGTRFLLTFPWSMPVAKIGPTKECFTSSSQKIKGVKISNSFSYLCWNVRNNRDCKRIKYNPSFGQQYRRNWLQHINKMSRNFYQEY
jgi:hypothetical protein